VSAADVELLGQLVERFNRDGLESTLDLFDKEVEWHTDPKWPDDRVYKGRGGIKRLNKMWLGNFDEYGWDVERTIDLGQRVVQLATLRARGRGEQDWIEQPLGLVVMSREGKIAYVQSWLDWDQALAAAGVSWE
jgi:SnoaL-like protein